MVKKAVISVRLVPKASEVSSSQIEKEIRENSQIPWSTQIEEVSVEESDDCYEKLMKHGLSKKAARNIVGFYEE
jgi:hypothetical protein